MALSKKHFEKIADIIWDADLSDGQKGEVALALAEYFAQENPDFSFEKFMDRATGCD